MKRLGPPFTALIAYGLAACFGEKHLVLEVHRATFLTVLGVSALLGLHSVRLGAAVASWAFLCLFFVGALVSAPACWCEGGTSHDDRLGQVLTVLFTGALGIYFASRFQPRVELPRVRVLARRRPG